MTTPIGHSLFALILYYLAIARERAWNLALFAALLIAALLPDFDYFPALWGDLRLANFNHQGFTHSLLFVLLAGIAVAVINARFGAGSARRIYPFVALAGLSHLLLDLVTYDGRAPIGIPLLWPFSETRFHGPVTLFGGVAKSSFADLFSLHNLFVIAGEIVILGSPAVVIWLLARRWVQSR